MDLIWSGLRDAVRVLLDNDYSIWEITWRTLVVSGTATIVSLLLGVGLGSALALNQFPGRNLVLTLVNTGMGMPPVVVGLFVAIMLWRSGPLGQFRFIYTTKAMIAAQTIIAAPIVISFTAAALASLHPQLRMQIYGLGASRLQMLWLLLREARLPLLAAVMAAFGAAVSEVGASIMVGGNLAGETRVLTTAVVLETSRGNFAPAIALSVILLAMIFLVNLILTTVQQHQRRM